MIDIVIPTLKSHSEIAKLSEEAVSKAGCVARAIATCINTSAAVNRNWGLDHSESDPVVMIDDDMEGFPDGWAVTMLKVLDDHPKCMVVSPQLAEPDGKAGYMMGGCKIANEGTTIATQRKLPTACIMFRRTHLRFDEIFIGSGFEDDDYCHQIVREFPDAEFRVCHDVWIVHRNERKNQHGKYWKHNQALYKEKWGLK